MNNMNVPVDMVFTYIDGRDPSLLHKRKLSEALYNEEDIHAERAEGKNFDMLYNNVDEITYSVRSVIKYLPWIRKIFIITDQQIPPVDQSFLNNGRICIVDHRDILNKNYLPTFNSEVVESCLHNIKDLSEIFLYNNDDSMHFSSVPKNALFRIMDDNRISLNLYTFSSVVKFIGHVISETLPARWSISSTYARGIADSFSILRKSKGHILWHDIITPKHMTMIIRKSTALRIEQEFGDVLHLLRMQKFRMQNTFSYSTILYTMEKHWHPYDQIHNHLFFDSSIRFQFFEFKKFTNTKTSAKRWKEVEDSPANFACLNNIRECQYESFIKVMKKKGLGDPVITRPKGFSKSQQKRQNHV